MRHLLVAGKITILFPVYIRTVDTIMCLEATRLHQMKSNFK